ncbi:hypothetical protein BJF79_47685 [Actinomadura sp. CNU-125]|uniref:hypothetical protein n=1 Tax=Actinomadura sp. CNU-125 TaxID=1904961 RepID=UPI000962937D|nr:hypothetical protein [Actinomadura sp. CNU-125]OLT19603.1 hypothetical protein BJF79_47685 [Actinomadura sp. CNU-125]
MSSAETPIGETSPSDGSEGGRNTGGLTPSAAAATTDGAATGAVDGDTTGAVDGGAADAGSVAVTGSVAAHFPVNGPAPGSSTSTTGRPDAGPNTTDVPSGRTTVMRNPRTGPPTASVTFSPPIPSGDPTISIAMARSPSDHVPPSRSSIVGQKRRSDGGRSRSFVSSLAM